MSRMTKLAGRDWRVRLGIPRVTDHGRRVFMGIHPAPQRRLLTKLAGKAHDRAATEGKHYRHPQARRRAREARAA